MKVTEKALRRLCRPVIIAAAVLCAAVLVTAGAMTVSNGFKTASSYLFAKEYIASLEPNELYSSLSGFISDSITEYENRAEAETKIKKLLSEGELSLLRADGFKDNKPKYTVCLDGKELYTLSLKRGGLFFGAWRADELSVSNNAVLGNELVIEVPSGATVAVNGNELSRASSLPVPYSKLTDFEAALSEEIGCDRYSLGRFFLTPDVSVVYDGTRLRTASVDKGILRFDYPQDKVSAYSVTVPTGATVTVNGIVAGSEYISASSLPYTHLSRFEKELSTFSSCVYTLPGLFNPPEISVTYSEKALVGEDGIYKLPEELEKTYVIAVPDSAVLKINGITAGSAEISVKKQDLPILSGVTGYAKQRPYLTEYTVTGLLSEPTFTVTDKDGKPLGVSKFYSTEERTVYNLRGGTAPDSVMAALANYSKAYIKYVYSANIGLESNYNAAIKYTPYSSPAYYALKNTYSSLYNAPQYKNFSYGKVNLLEYYKYSDSSYSAVFEMPFTATRNGETVSFTVTFDILGNFSGTRRWINYKVLSTVQG